MVHRRLYDYLIAGGKQSAHSHADTLDDTRYESHPFGLHLPPVVLLHPTYDARPIAIRQGGITKEGMSEPCRNSLGDEGRGLPVHVGDPQGEQVGASPAFCQSGMLHIACASTVDRLVEIICHHSHCLYACTACHSYHKVKHLARTGQAIRAGLCHAKPFYITYRIRRRAVKTF